MSLMLLLLNINFPSKGKNTGVDITQASYKHYI